MGRTKKVGSAGRFGPRYGLKIRKRIRDIEAVVRRRQRCPKCDRVAAKRVASGIFICRKCGAKFTGKAYSPE